MDSHEKLPKTAEVEDMVKAAAGDINSTTQQAHHLKQKAKIVPLKKKGSRGGAGGVAWGARRRPIIVHAHIILVERIQVSLLLCHPTTQEAVPGICHMACVIVRQRQRGPAPFL